MFATQPKKLNIGYDQDHDVLYVSIGDPVPSYCDEDIEGVLFRKSISTNTLSGITIMGFAKKTKQQLIRILPTEINVEELYQ